MTQSLKPLVQGAVLKTVPEPLYTAAAGTFARITQLTVTNTTTTSATVSVFLVDDAAAPGNDDFLIFEKAVPAKGTISFDQAIGHVIGENGTIQATASTDDLLVLKVSGVEQTS